jgi:hypothetical protein
MQNLKAVKSLSVSPRLSRDRFIGLRLRSEDAERLTALARDENVGVSTFARLILEEFVATHERKKRGKR